MSFMSMLIAFLITSGVALVFALLIVFASPQESRHRTKSQLFRDMFVSPYATRRPNGYASWRRGNAGMGEWLNEEIERGKQVQRPRGSRVGHTKSHHH